MSVLLWSLPLVLALLGLLLVTALATPLELDFKLRSSPKWRMTINARLLGGFAPPIVIHDSNRRNRKEEKQRQAEADQMSKKPGALHGRGSRMVTAGPRLLQDLLRQIHFEQLTVDADVGLGDPADTGHLYGLLAPLVYSVPPTSPVTISVRPDFAATRFSGDVLAKLSFVPVALMPPAVRFAWHVFGPRS